MFFEARKASSRSSKLAGVLLLRKVPQLVSADHIETIMKSVPRSHYRRRSILEMSLLDLECIGCEYGFN